MSGPIDEGRSRVKDQRAAITNIKHPVSVARAVMEHTEGASCFAQILGFESGNPVTALTVDTLRKNIQRAEKERDAIYRHYLSSARKKLQELTLSTVGAVAWDGTGHLAAATSTGGIELQLPGRVGDSPLIGCGAFACEWGAVSMTGEGEGIIRLGLARKIGEWMETMSAPEAVERGMELALRSGVVCGAIALDRSGGRGWGAQGGTLLWRAGEGSKPSADQ